MTTNNDNNIARPQRKSPREVENTSASSEPKERMKKKRKKYNYICSNEGCTNNVQKGGGCIRHGLFHLCAVANAQSNTNNSMFLLR